MEHIWAFDNSKLFTLYVNKTLVDAGSPLRTAIKHAKDYVFFNPETTVKVKQNGWTFAVVKFGSVKVRRGIL